jgi:hypothetical protein
MCRKSRRDGIIGPESQFGDNAAADVARAKTAETLNSSRAAVDASNVISFDCINRDPAVEHERTKAPLSGHESAVLGGGTVSFQTVPLPGFDVRLKSYRRSSGRR